jgi:hypothetical protein
MYVRFFVSLFGFIAVILPYFLSLEHRKLEEKYGKEKGKTIGAICGIVSGWVFFLFWFGIWLSPQIRFTIPLFQGLFIQLPVVNPNNSLASVADFHTVFCGVCMV